MNLLVEFLCDAVGLRSTQVHYIHYINLNFKHIHWVLLVNSQQLIREKIKTVHLIYNIVICEFATLRVNDEYFHYLNKNHK